MKTISALQARSRLGTILDEVSQEHIHYIIERLSKPLVVVIPFHEYYEIFGKKSLRNGKEELFQALADFRKKYGKRMTGEKGTTALLHRLRADRDKSLGPSPAIT